MKKAIITIQSNKGENKSSIIRAISQILIGLNRKAVVNVGELGLSESISSVVELDQLKIGVGSQRNGAASAYEMIDQLIKKSCDAILCTTGSLDDKILNTMATENGYEIKGMKSSWSEKLQVDYLSEDQIDEIVGTIRKIESESQINKEFNPQLLS